MTEALIYDAIRTPRGKGKPTGALHNVKPLNLLTQVLESLEKRNQLNTQLVEDVIMGCVTPIGEQGGNIARTAVLNAGWSQATPGMTLNRFCSSGLEAVHLAATKVLAGQADLVVAGGVESMSRVAMGSDGGAWLEDSETIKKLKLVPQGISADLIATLEQFSRFELDSFAATSQQRAHLAAQKGYFSKSLVPILDSDGTCLLDHDEIIRGQTTPEVLATLKPAFAKMGEAGMDKLALKKYTQLSGIQHVHHAGNSSGIVDGAAAVLIGTEQIHNKTGLKPRARIKAMATVGSEPTIMLTGPTPAAEQALKRAGLGVQDIDLFEINEAFAAVVLKTIRDLHLDPDKVNVNGGAIAMGHPLGATGTMLVGTLIDELERRDQTFGLVSMCVGAGMGVATVIERLN